MTEVKSEFRWEICQIWSLQHD